MFTLWQGDTCMATFRLRVAEAGRLAGLLIGALTDAATGAAAAAPVAISDDDRAGAAG